MRGLERLSVVVSSQVSRRSALRRMGAAAVAVASMVTLGGSAYAQTVTTGRRNFCVIQRPRADEGIRPEACGIYCNPVDCCGCCNTLHLFRCDDACAGNYFWACSSPCSGFCFSQAC